MNHIVIGILVIGVAVAGVVISAVMNRRSQRRMDMLAEKTREGY